MCGRRQRHATPHLFITTLLAATYFSTAGEYTQLTSCRAQVARGSYTRSSDSRLTQPKASHLPMHTISCSHSTRLSCVHGGASTILCMPTQQALYSSNLGSFLGLLYTGDEEISSEHAQITCTAQTASSHMLSGCRSRLVSSTYSWPQMRLRIARNS